MQASALDTITKLIQSPPGQLAVGGTLFYGVQKFFKEVEEKLTDNTKLEIALWLLGVKVGPNVEPWPETFAKVFDRVFGTKHLSWKCFRRSCLATLTSCVIIAVGLAAYLHPIYVPYSGEQHPTIDYVLFVPMLGVIAAIYLCLFDYVSLLETRFALGLLQRWSSWYIVLIVLVADVIVTGVTGGVPADLTLGLKLHPFRTFSQRVVDDERIPVRLKRSLERERLDVLAGRSKLAEIEKQLNELDRESVNLNARMRKVGSGKIERQKAADIDKQRFDLEGERSRVSRKDLTELDKEIAAQDSIQKSGYMKKVLLLQAFSLWLPTFFTSIWLWLYAGSGFLLKAARHFDRYLGWFNRILDIEKKPLSSIGLVAGSIVAVIYWSAVIVVWII
jgi:hypothetical protein